MDAVTSFPEDQLSEKIKADRLELYRDSNDAFRQLLQGKFGKLPLGFPADWVYESAFGADNYQQAIESRTDVSPLTSLANMDINAESKILQERLHRQPTEEELVIYLNHPGDALKTIDFNSKFGDPNLVPLDVWFEGLEIREALDFKDSHGKPHRMTIEHISRPDKRGMSVLQYNLDSEIFSHQVQVKEPEAAAAASAQMVDPKNIYHVGAPSSGDLWVVYVQVGDVVKKGEELFNISIMKQEKAILSPIDGVVKRVIKFANYQEDRKMIPVKEGELLIELGPVPNSCPTCRKDIVLDGAGFCPFCGQRL
jgi:pyruvate carboxylase